MSIIFGLVGRNGQPVAGEELGGMQKPYLPIPADGSFLWREGEIGLGVIQRYDTPESTSEVFPQHSRCGRYTFISHARLDNREELLRCLEIPPDRASLTPDSTLLALAYERWEDGFVDHLAGDWVTAVWVRDRRRLLIAMGPTANCALFYTSTGSHFAFSSTIHALLTLPWVATTPDLNVLGYFLSGAADRVLKSSFLRGIHALPPAHLLVLERERMNTLRYWSIDQVQPLRLRDDREYIDAFLEKYRKAVTRRLRSYRGGGATLSGGFDSGSVVALAAEAIRPEGRSLPVFSAVPRFDFAGCIPANRCGDETPYILATAETAGNVEVNFLRSDAVTPVSGIMALTEAAGSPIFGAVNCFWMHDLLLSAQQRGLGVILTGQGGNGTVSWNGSRYFWDYLNTPSTGQAFGALVRWLRGQGSLKFGMLLLRGVVPVAGFRALMRLWGQPSPSEAFLSDTPLKREFITSLHLKDHFHRLDSLCLQASRKLRHGLIEFTNGLGGRYWYQFGMPYGVDVRDPTMDKELLEFLLSIPEEQYNRENEDRRLIRHGMASLLPGRVRYAAERGLQGADIIHRIRNSADEVFAVLNSLEKSHLARESLDLDAMRRVAVRTMRELSPDMTRLCGTVLCRGISAGLFLKRYG